MKATDVKAYLTLLGELDETLDRLTEVEQAKTRAVQSDDLAGVNDCMNQEQALGLALRGFEQRRTAALAALGLEGVPLRALADRLPAEHRPEARQAVGRLQEGYRLYQAAAQVARNTLECNLHEIEKVLADLGGERAPGPGYQREGPELPPAMHTDLRA